MKKMEPNKKTGRKKLSPKELEARAELLATETPEQRSKRVLNPRFNRFFKTYDSIIYCISSPRYKLSQEQQNIVLSETEKRTIALKTAFDKKDKKEVKNIL